MIAQNKFPSRVWSMILEAVSWTLLIPGFILVGKSSLEIVAVEHVTTNILSGSSAGLLFLLIGWLMHSCRREYQPDAFSSH